MVEVPHPPAAVDGKANELKPLRTLPGYALVEHLPRMSVNLAVKYLGPVCEVPEHHRGDRAVVGDQGRPWCSTAPARRPWVGACSRHAQRQPEPRHVSLVRPADDADHGGAVAGEADGAVAAF